MLLEVSRRSATWMRPDWLTRETFTTGLPDGDSGDDMCTSTWADAWGPRITPKPRTATPPSAPSDAAMNARRWMRRLGNRGEGMIADSRTGASLLIPQ